MLKTLLFTLLWIPMFIAADIIEVSSMDQVEHYFLDSHEETLGIFDIDDTLTVSHQVAFHERNRKEHKKILKQLLTHLDLEKFDLLGNLKLTMSPSQLIEKNTPLFLDQLRKNNINLIALSAAMTSTINGVYIPELRYEELKRNEIDFSDTFKEFEILSLENLSLYQGSYPIFYKGVLCSNGDKERVPAASSKADVLCAFLEKVQYQPKKIIFVDDKIHHLLEMEKILKDRHPDVIFHGLHYTGIKFFSSLLVSESNFEYVWSHLLNTAEQVFNKAFTHPEEV